MSKPLIGITTSQINRSHSQKANLVLTDYTDAIRSAGGIPLLIPNEYPLEDIEVLRGRLNGVLLTGGGDINQALYQGENDNHSLDIVEKRDRLEKALVDLAVRSDWSLLGICRGQQMLNVALGGTLYTDIPSQYDTAILHNQPDSRQPAHLVHEVNITHGSLLAGIIGSECIRVNSRHHQAVKDLAPGLTVTARASDGLIEGVELPGHRFCLGVQWHPESLQAVEEHSRIFTRFIIAAGTDPLED